MLGRVKNFYIPSTEFFFLNLTWIIHGPASLRHSPARLIPVDLSLGDHGYLLCLRCLGQAKSGAVLTQMRTCP
ncbi:MAG: hypothetical protein PHQ48_07650 [Acidobacteriota bacterium]|nr:hypothetical protein [Acidobacteriota bacterium]